VGDQAATVIADQTRRLHRELEGLWAAADLVALARALAASQFDAAHQAQLIRRIGELDDRIGDSLVQVEDTAAALSEAVSAIR
jgi:hypothetical protein